MTEPTPEMTPESPWFLGPSFLVRAERDDPELASLAMEYFGRDDILHDASDASLDEDSAAAINADIDTILLEIYATEARSFAGIALKLMITRSVEHWRLTSVKGPQSNAMEVLTESALRDAMRLGGLE
jgi:hypothetical protein